MNILYVTHRVPWPPDKGDRIRNWHVLRQLAGTGTVKLASLADEPVPPATLDKLNGICEALSIEPVTKTGKLLNAAKSALAGHSLSEGIFANAKLKTTIEQWHRKTPFDAVVLSASSLVGYAIAGVPTFVDVVDVDSQKWHDFAEAVSIPKRWLYRFESSRLRTVERELPKWAHTITLVSDAESEVFNRIAGRDCATTATNGVDLEYFSFSRDAEALRSGARVLAFTGAMDYLPNIDAVTWFAKHVWPALENQNLEFRIIGRNPAPSVLALAKDGITVTGSVADVRECMKDVSIAVVPMRLGRGLQNKVLEALAMGKAVIASPPALAALKAVPGRDLLQATTPEEWITAIQQLLEDEPLRRSLGENGRKFVEEHHDWQTCLKPLTDRLRSLAREEVFA